MGGNRGIEPGKRKVKIERGEEGGGWVSGAGGGGESWKDKHLVENT